MAEPTTLITKIKVDLREFDSIKKLFVAAPAWLEEVTSREATQAEKLLFAAFMEIAENDSKPGGETFEDQPTASETKCYDCESPINEGYMVTHDHVSGLVFCKICSPTYAEMLADHDSYACGNDAHGDPVYLTTEAAQKLADEHIAKGGALTDKFGLTEY